VTSDPQRSVTSNADVTFGYNTAEALPMTVYYRHTSEDDGRPRPSLEYLHEGRVELHVPEQGSEVSHTAEIVCVTSVPNMEYVCVCLTRESLNFF